MVYETNACGSQCLEACHLKSPYAILVVAFVFVGGYVCTKTYQKLVFMYIIFNYFTQIFVAGTFHKNAADTRAHDYKVSMFASK
jgi:hypothetical protein